VYVGVRYGVAEVDEGVLQLAQLAQEDLATKAHDSNRCSETCSEIGEILPIVVHFSPAHRPITNLAISPRSGMRDIAGVARRSLLYSRTRNEPHGGSILMGTAGVKVGCGEHTR